MLDVRLTVNVIPQKKDTTFFMYEKRVSSRRRKASMTSRFSSETEKTCLKHHTIMIQQNRSQNMWMKLQCISTCFYLRKMMQKIWIHRFHVLFLSSLILQCLECSGVCIFQKKTASSFFLQCVKLLNCTLVVFYSNFLFVLFFCLFLSLSDMSNRLSICV